MGWRANMGAAKRKNNVSNPIDTIDVIDKNPSKNSQAHSSVNVVSFVKGIPKVKTPEIIIKKMSNCLHGSMCRFITLVDDRQICSRNNKAIFDMAVCPDGRWWKLKLEDKVKANAAPCFCCGSQTFWRKKDNTGGRWICEVCHPPALSKDEIEFLQ